MSGIWSKGAVMKRQWTVLMDVADPKVRFSNKELPQSVKASKDGRFEIRLSVEAPSASEAVSAAEAALNKLARKAGVTEWPLVRAYATTGDGDEAALKF